MIYRFTLNVANDDMMLRIQRLIMMRGTLLQVEKMPDDGSDVIDVPTIAPHLRNDEKIIRNQEIVDKYFADPKANSSEKLAIEYGLSRERVCQILRRSNAIATAKERKEAVKGAYDDLRQQLTETAKQEYEQKITEALDLMRQGKSMRQAAIAVGFQAHSNFSNVLANRAKVLGIPMFHGPHRDFEPRKAKVRELWEQGLPVYKIVAKLRDDGADKTINENWVYANMPELKKGRWP